MRENKIEDHLVDEARRHGGVALKLAMIGKRNFPDRTLLLPYAFIVFVELKASKKEMRKSQSWFARHVLIPLGFRVITINDLGQSKELFEEYREFAKLHESKNTTVETRPTPSKVRRKRR